MSLVKPVETAEVPAEAQGRWQGNKVKRNENIAAVGAMSPHDIPLSIFFPGDGTHQSPKGPNPKTHMKKKASRESSCKQL